MSAMLVQFRHSGWKRDTGRQDGFRHISRNIVATLGVLWRHHTNHRMLIVFYVLHVLIIISPSEIIVTLQRNRHPSICCHFLSVTFTPKTAALKKLPSEHKEGNGVEFSQSSGEPRTSLKAFLGKRHDLILLKSGARLNLSGVKWLDVTHPMSPSEPKSGADQLTWMKNKSSDWTIEVWLAGSYLNLKWHKSYKGFCRNKSANRRLGHFLRCVLFEISILCCPTGIHKRTRSNRTWRRT